MFTEEMQKALEADAKKLNDLGVPTENPIFWDFHCNKCGSSGEEKFSWNGECLVCEDGGDRFDDDEY